MDTFYHILKLSAGIGLFICNVFTGGVFKKIFLEGASSSFTTHYQEQDGAVTGGAIVKVVLQSSSMVSFMVLFLCGRAGVFTMRNAMAIILGANLGTTLDSWVVAGLKMDI
jgi:phosphate:Na+ symporter